MAIDLRNQHPHPLKQPHVSFVSATISGGQHSRTAANSAVPLTLNLLRRDPLTLTGEQQSLIFQTGEVYYSQEAEKCKQMTRRNGPKLDLQLNLSPPRVNQPRVESPSRSLTISPSSTPSSCLSSEQDESLMYSTSPEATSMLLVGCPRCLMYVMLSEEDPRCPKCKSTVLLDVINDNSTSTTVTAAATTSSRRSKKS